MAEGFAFLDERGVGGLDIGQQREGVEGGAFGVVGEAGVQGGHGGDVVVGGFLEALRVFGEEGVERADVGEFARGGLRGAGGELAGFGHLFRAGFGLLVVGASPELLELAHGDAPVGHGAGGVGGGDGAELGFGFDVAEGVQQRDAALERRLLGRGAGDGEVDVAELFGGGVVVVMVLHVHARHLGVSCCGGEADGKRGRAESGRKAHGARVVEAEGAGKAEGNACRWCGAAV